MGCRRNLVLLSAWILGSATGWSATADALPPGERILADAVAVMRIHQPQWLDKEAARFAAALGMDPAPLRALIASGLFRCRSLEGLDLGRPALLAWRPGPAPLVAILPIRNRRAFLDQFGTADDAPFIRVGERDGTVVYTQVGNEGLSEYRLMVGENNVACLARSAAECRALAAITLPRPGGSEAPLAFTARGTWITGLTGDRATAQVPAPFVPAVSLWNSLTAQIADLALELRPDGADGMRIAFRLKAVPDSLLAVWISNQRNQPNRLLPLVRTPATMLSFCGQVAWQGQGESFGSAIGGLVKAPAGKAWNESVDEAWTALWTLSDRNGPFAGALDLQIDAAKATKRAATAPGRTSTAKAPPAETPASAAPNPLIEAMDIFAMEWRSLVEQRRATEVVAHTNAVTSTLTGTPGEPLTVIGAQGFRWTPPLGVASAMVATDRHVIQVQGNLRPVDQAVAELVQKSQGNAVPDPATAIIMAALDATPVVRSVAVMMHKPLDAITTPVPITAALRTAGTAELVLDVGLPHIGVATMIRDHGLLANDPPDNRRGK